eukprot:Seg15642.2 transcript_id=Seg15642.2/GoldUCD/mRNA.D3Y31 product="Regulatory protein SoxS" protein_id=Seg15642.2/GoldUCD/D3Y31
MSLTPCTFGMWARTGNNEHANRLLTTEEHECITISASYQWIKQTFGSQQELLHPMVKQVLTTPNSPPSSIGHVQALTVPELAFAKELIAPPVQSSATPFWYPAKVVEAMSLHLFPAPSAQPHQLFCTQVKSESNRRITNAVNWLQNHLDEPLDLTALAKEVGCTPHYMSRLFAEQTGKTLKQTLRNLRIEKAASLLSDGDYNVTEAAVEVGYNSLSHFTKAFVEEKGMTPSKFRKSLSA